MEIMQDEGSGGGLMYGVFGKGTLAGQVVEKFEPLATNTTAIEEMLYN